MESLESETSVRLICISDAHTHIERLAFVAMRSGDEYSAVPSIGLAGINTMMIHGGDSRAVYDYGRYMSDIAKVNGFDGATLDGNTISIHETYIDED